MKAKVRLKGILRGVLDQSSDDNIPMPLISFLSTLVKKGQYMPDGFLFPFELDRVNLDDYAALMSINDK
jgi:hypothetical protein